METTTPPNRARRRNRPPITTQSYADLAAALPKVSTQTMGVTHTLQVTTQTIAAKDARSWLAHNLHNRNLRLPVVRNYARDMIAGNWFPAVENIVFDWDGNLINGQHTLHALIEATVAAKREIFINVIVVRGQDPKAQDVLDAGPARKVGDQLSIKGEQNATALAAAARYAMIIDIFGGDAPYALRTLKPTHSEIIKWIDDNPSIRDAIREASPLNRELHYPTSAAAAMMFLMAKASDWNTTKQFFDTLARGTDTEPGSPLHTLRRALINDLASPRRMERDVRSAITIKAWNAWRNERSVRLLLWRRAEEAFPTPV